MSGGAVAASYVAGSPWEAAVAALAKASDWAWWRLAETSGTTAEDSSPNNYDGTHSGSTLTLGEPSLLVTPDTDKSIKYTGASAVTQRAQEAWMNNANFSVILLFKTGALNATNVLAARDHQSNGRVFQLQISSAGVISFIILANNGGSVYTITSPSGYADGNPHLLVATYNQAQDQQTGKMNLCLDDDTRVIGGGANNLGAPSACPLSCGASTRTSSAPAQSWIDEFIFLPGIVTTDAERLSLDVARAA